LEYETCALQLHSLQLLLSQFLALLLTLAALHQQSEHLSQLSSLTHQLQWAAQSHQVLLFLVFSALWLLHQLLSNNILDAMNTKKQASGLLFCF
jgi:hypothetical protein